MFASPSIVDVLRQRTKVVRCWVQTMSQSYTTSAALRPTGGWRVEVTRHRSRQGSTFGYPPTCARPPAIPETRRGLRDGHCRRLHAIEQQKMKPQFDAMRPFLAD